MNGVNASARVTVTLMLTIAATLDIALAADGMLKTRKLPSGTVEAPPAEVKKLPTDIVVAPEHMQPGTHTLTLDVAQKLPKGKAKWFHGGTDCQESHKFFATGEVGWGEIEFGEAPCAAIVYQLAVQFDNGPIDAIPTKTIDRAVLTYDETPGYSCGAWVYQESATCWQDGVGKREPKPDGCGVVRIPKVAWYESEPPGLIPYFSGSPAVRRVDTREWDVTEPYVWQHVQGKAPLGDSPGFGYLLTGSITDTSELEAEDDTICVSSLTNIKLNVTYTVPPPETPPDVIR